MTTRTRKKGATWKMRAIIRIEGVPVTDFTGYDISMALKNQLEDEEPVAFIELGDGIEVIDSGLGKIECVFTPEITSALEIRKYLADLRIENVANEVDFSSTFTIDCVQNITGVM